VAPKVAHGHAHALLLAVAFAVVASAGPARAALDLNWYTFDGGGITFATGGPYTLGATAGQPDAGVLLGGTYQLNGGFWRGGVTTPSAVETPGPGGQPGTGVPLAFLYGGAAPNPAGASTMISFQLPAAGPVTLRIFAADGRLVRELVNASLAAGPQRVTWDGRDDAGSLAAAGVYYLRLVAGPESAEQKLVRIR
jgi:hypothetical protein